MGSLPAIAAAASPDGAKLNPLSTACSTCSCIIHITAMPEKESAASDNTLRRAAPALDCSTRSIIDSSNTGYEVTGDNE
jgi:hypothetical protein